MAFNRHPIDTWCIHADATIDACDYQVAVALESSQKARVALKISVLCCLPARGRRERAKRTAKREIAAAMGHVDI